MGRGPVDGRRGALGQGRLVFDEGWSGIVSHMVCLVEIVNRLELQCDEKKLLGLGRTEVLKRLHLL